ncbi:MAG: adenosine deaminase [Gammaproteobacteria bacterium]|nr:adenosine deaminase [Gammaproteobacteria bacterium]
MKKLTITVIALFSSVLLAACSAPDHPRENQDITSDYFDSIKDEPVKLQLFLNDMPKGGDLHNHLSGAVYAEDVIQFAGKDGFCIDPKTLNVSKNPHCASQYQLSNLKNNYDLYNQLVNYWSLRTFARATPDSRLDFFDSFLRDVIDLNPHRGEIIANLAQRNADEHVDYVELLVLPQTDQILSLGSQLTLQDNNYQQAQAYLQQHGIQTVVNQMQQQIDGWVATKNSILHCGAPDAAPGCGVTIRMQYIALRAVPSNLVFTQLLAGFLLAQQDPNVVGVNIVGPEDAPLTLENYAQQMAMFDYLHNLYPQVKISLHAGELVPGLVPPEALRSHITQAVYIGHADRIGHGSDIMYEPQTKELLHYMAEHHIAVEEALTSNAQLLQLKGKDHPIELYLSHHVPVTLNTDDEGVLRTDLTQEYRRAVLTYGFSYSTIKQFARNALTYNFMPGDSLWQDAEQATPVAACASDTLGAAQPSPDCAKFLQASPKAKLQWQLEQEFAQFEQQIAADHPNI